MHRHIIKTVDQPAAGADWSTVPSNGDWTRVLSITAQLVTSATVANRAPDLLTTDVDGNVIAADGATAVQAAGETLTWDWRPRSGFNGTTTPSAVVGSTAPDFWLPPGASVATKTVNIAAADQWSAVVVVFLVADEWHAMQLEAAVRRLIGG